MGGGEGGRGRGGGEGRVEGEGAIAPMCRHGMLSISTGAWGVFVKKYLLVLILNIPDSWIFITV